MVYQAPVNDMVFALRNVVDFDRLCALPGQDELSIDLVSAVLEEAGKLAAGVIHPLNIPGDNTGSRRNDDGSVTTPDGFADAYKQFTEGGWNAMSFPADIGGMGLPRAVSMAAAEMWSAANSSFALCPLLTQAAIEAVHQKGTDWQKRMFLEKLVTGEWTGTMNLTEPQAGSDLGALRCKAERADDGTYRITGQKIYITYGEHDMADNIVHTVLARLPDAPDGVKGISMFIVPKHLPAEDGSVGERNDVHCLSLEHKLGLHASPTGVMSYGEKTGEGAVGYLVGEENRGLQYMFIMMNSARIGVGLQGVGLADGAYQHALAYARDRVQGKPVDGSSKDRVAIIEHADIRRMLLEMRAGIEATRALTYYAGSLLDIAERSDDADEVKAAQGKVDLLTPIVKAWGTDHAVETASTGIQIHGGMGFIEETGAAQYYRDVRVFPIYEGTNGIQANDLVFRKVLRDGGETVKGFIAEMRDVAAGLAKQPGDDCAVIREQFETGISHLETATDWLLQTGKDDPQAASAVAVPYLRLFSMVAGGFVMGKSAIAANDQLRGANDNPDFLETKMMTARFFAEHLLPKSAGYLQAATQGYKTVLSMDSGRF